MTRKINTPYPYIIASCFLILVGLAIFTLIYRPKAEAAPVRIETVVLCDSSLGAEHNGFCDFHGVDVGGIRNLQGGRPGITGNFDLGAGSVNGKRGNLTLNYDVGNCIKLGDGRTHILIRVCPRSHGGLWIRGLGRVWPKNR